ncbi:MAG TPA: hypothetical protein VMB50_21455 [Myxococcales bacterium]|nr:hypothetical protein [Myxococcales bacterium]
MPASLLLALALGLKLGAAPACPSAAALVRALAEVGDPVDGNGSRVDVERVPEGLRVAFAAPDGSSVRRVLPDAASCDELAKAAAVTLAIWDAHFAPALRTVVRPRPAPAGVEEASAPEGPRLEGALAAGLDAAYAASGGSVVGQLFGWLGPRQGLWAGEASLLFDGPRQAAVGSGQASWEREALGLGAFFKPSWGDWTLAADAQVLLGVLEVAGSGFASPQSHTGFDVGGAVGLRVLWTRFRIVPWAGVQGVAWFLNDRAVEGASATATNLSTLELWGGAGGLYHFE